MNKTEIQRNCRLIKIGSWVLVIAGFGHFLMTFLDLFMSGLFSPPEENIIIAMKDVSINLIEILKGNETSLFESMWGAYIGFNFSHGIGVGFFGLIHILLVKGDERLFIRNKNLLLVSIVISTILLLISICFWFYVPSVLVLINLVCLVTAWLRFRQMN